MSASKSKIVAPKKVAASSPKIAIIPSAAQGTVVPSAKKTATPAVKKVATPAAKKTPASKKTATPPPQVEEVEDEILICTEEECVVVDNVQADDQDEPPVVMPEDDYEEQAILEAEEAELEEEDPEDEEVYEDELVEEAEELDEELEEAEETDETDEADEELEEFEEEEEIEEEADYRSAPEPRSSAKSPVHKRLAGKRSPRLGMMMSPRAAAPGLRKATLYTKFSNMKKDELIFDEDTIMDQQLTTHENLRAPDVLTWLKKVDAYPYFYEDNGNIVEYDQEAMCYPVETAEDVECAFELFECRHGILVFSPTEDVDFGEDQADTVPMSRYEDYLSVVPVLSSGESGGDVRFVEEFTLWGLIPRETYAKYVAEDDAAEATAKKTGKPVISPFRDRMKTVELINPADVELDYEE